MCQTQDWPLPSADTDLEIYKQKCAFELDGPPWHGHGLGRHRNTSACLSLSPLSTPLPSSSAWLMHMAGPLHSHPVWFSEVCISHVLSSIAVRRPALPSCLLCNCSPYLLCYCLITWLGAESTVMKTANSLFFRLFRRGYKWVLKRDLHA